MILQEFEATKVMNSGEQRKYVVIVRIQVTLMVNVGSLLRQKWVFFEENI